MTRLYALTRLLALEPLSIQEIKLVTLWPEDEIRELLKVGAFTYINKGGFQRYYPKG